MVLEKDIEANVVKWAKDRNFLTPKVRFVENGYPDRLFISPKGHTIFIEFKKPGEKPEPLQNFRLQQLRQRSIPAYWCDTYVGAINILKAALEPETVSEASHKTLVESSVRRLIPRPRTGQDVDGPRYDQDPEGEKPHSGSSDRGSAAGGDDNMA